MEISSLALYVAGALPNTTIQATVDAASKNPRGAVWIPASYAAVDVYQNPNSVPIFDLRGSGSISFGGSASIQRLAFTGTPQISANIVPGSGWGSTAAISAVSGQDSCLRFTLTCSGSGITTAPTLVITFIDGAWNSPPFVTMLKTGGTGITSDCSVVVTTTNITMTYDLTPTASQTYQFTVLVSGVA
jgi:hypothetical protein